MAQVGRISGPLLFANLERQGKNLDFRNATNSTPTLKLDVTNNNIGVNVLAPAFDLDVNNTVKATSSEIASASPGNFVISNDDITATTGPINFLGNVNLSRIRTQQIDVNDNRLSTYATNANLNLISNGTGTIELQANTNVMGNVHATGDITIGGNLTIGNDAQDTITLNSDVDSNIIPDVDNTFDLGTSYDDSAESKTWRNTNIANVTGNISTSTTATIDNIDFTLRAGNIFYVSPLGQDTNKGDHPQSQFKTIRRALDAADSSSAGPSIIHIAPGEYDEQLPLTVPANTSIKGSELRNVIIFPDTSSQSEDVFLVDGDTTIEDVTIKDFYYDSVNDKGYAIRYKPNATVTARSPYIRNVTVLTKGSVTSASDPRGYNEGDAGRAVLVDGADVTASSQEASMLFHAFTAITPGAQAITLTNGVRVEWLNSFTYFAETGIKLVNGSTGHQSSDGSTIKYGAELRCIGSATIYGNKGIVADGNDCIAYLIDQNFAYIGVNERSDNDPTTVVQSNEVTELNNGKVLFSSVDHNGDFRVGGALFVDATTGEVDIESAAFDFSGTDRLTIRTQGNSVVLDSTQVKTDLIRFSGNTVETISDTLHLNSAGVINILDNTNITGHLDISGNVTIGGALVRLGDADTDNINLSADVISDLTPNFNNTYNLGSSTKYWGRLFSDQLDLDEISISGNSIITHDTNSDLLINPAGTGKTRISSLEVGTDSTAGTTTLDEEQIYNGNLFVNSSTTFNGNIVANKNITLHTVTTNSVNAQGMANFENVAFLGNVITSTESNSDLEMRPNGTGKITINSSVEADNITTQANYSFGSATMSSSQGEKLVTNNYDVENQIIGDIRIEGNVIETLSSNADLELRANKEPVTVTVGPQFSVNAEENAPRAVTFNNDGTKMFIAGTQGDDVSEYTLSTAFDLSSTVTYVDSLSVINNPTAVKFNLDGTKMYVTGPGTNCLTEYNLSTAFDVSTGVFSQNSPVWTNLVTPSEDDTFGFDFNNDGTKLYVTGNQRDKIYEFDLPSAFDISSITFVQDLYVGLIDIEPFGIEWSPNGRRLLIVGTRGNGVDQFNVATPFDISTAEHLGFYFIGGNPSGIHISPDGTKMFIVGNNHDKVKEYTLSAPYQIAEKTGGSTIELREDVLISKNLSVNTIGGVAPNISANDLSINHATINTTLIAPGTTFGSIKLHGNKIETTDSNADLQLRANGTGTVQLEENVTVADNVNAVDVDTQISNINIANFNNVTITNNVTAPTSISMEGIHFLGNTIRTVDSNADLELRASGTGKVSLQENVQLDKDLTVVGNTTSTGGNIQQANTNTATTNRITSATTMLPGIAIYGNSIQTYNSNSDIELVASGSGNVVMNDSAGFGKNLDVNGTLTVDGIVINAQLSTPELQMSGNITFDDNFITTTDTNSNLELKANGSALVELDQLRIRDNVMDTKTADSTAADIVFKPDTYLQVDTTGDVVIPKGDLPLYAQGQLHYDTSKNHFVGYNGTVQRRLGGLASDDLETRIEAVSDSNKLDFYTNNTKVMSMGYPNATSMDRLELTGLDIDANTISVNNTNANLLLLPEQGDGRVVIDNLEFHDSKIVVTGPNTATLSGTDDGYVKFSGTGGVRIPIGGSAGREPTPELGHARFNTNLAYLEVFDGADWVTAAGTGAGVSDATMQEIMNEYILIFG